MPKNEAELPVMVIKMISSHAWSKETVLKNTNTLEHILLKIENTVIAKQLTLNQKRARIYAALTQLEFYLADLMSLSGWISEALKKAKDALNTDNFEPFLLQQVHDARSYSAELRSEVKKLA